MNPINPIAYRRKTTGKVLLKKTGDANYTAFGAAVSLSPSSDVQRTDVITPDKGFNNVSAKLISQTELKYDVQSNEMTPEVLALAHLAAVATDVVQSSATGLTAAATSWKYRQAIQLSRYNVTNVAVKNAGNTITYVNGVDYVLDAGAGHIFPIAGGSITEGQTLNITYDCPAITRSSITAFTERVTEGLVEIHLFDQHSDEPIEVHKFPGFWFITDKSMGGNDIWTVTLQINCKTRPVIEYRKVN